MEKISQIVRGNSRVGSVDLKSSPALRPGVPSFGRPMGESLSGLDKSESTASRAAAIQNELNEIKRSHSQDRVMDDVSNQFFMSRMRRPEETVKTTAPNVVNVPSAVESELPTEIKMTDAMDSEGPQPMGFTPRGTFVDVRV